MARCKFCGVREGLGHSPGCRHHASFSSPNDPAREPYYCVGCGEPEGQGHRIGCSQVGRTAREYSPKPPEGWCSRCQTAQRDKCAWKDCCWLDYSGNAPGAGPVAPSQRFKGLAETYGLPDPATVDQDPRIAELENALRAAVYVCRTQKGYPTLQSELVSAIARSVGVNVDG